MNIHIHYKEEHTVSVSADTQQEDVHNMLGHTDKNCGLRKLTQNAALLTLFNAVLILED